MSESVKIVLNSDGVKELLRSQEMMNVCTDLAYKAQSRLGDGYEVTNHTGKNRVNASIIANTPETLDEQLKSNTILKALGSM